MLRCMQGDVEQTTYKSMPSTAAKLYQEGGFGRFFCGTWIFLCGLAVTGEVTSGCFARDGDAAPRRGISDSRKSGWPAFSFSGVLRIARTFGKGVTTVSTACAHNATYRSRDARLSFLSLSSKASPEGRPAGFREARAMLFD